MTDTRLADDASVAEPALFSAAWRYRWLVLGVTALGIALALVYAVARSETYAATASVFIEDPLTGILGSGTSTRPERYVLDQVEVFRSSIVANTASGLVADIEPEVAITPEEFREGARIAARAETDLISVTFTAEDPIVAQVGANALVQAYERVRSDATSSSTTAALAQVDTARESIDNELIKLESEIAALRREDQARNNLDRQYQQAIAELGVQQEALMNAEDTEDPLVVEAIRARLDDILQQLETMRVIETIEASDPDFAVLLREQTSLIERRAALAATRNQMLIDSQMESNGIALFSPAELGEPANFAGSARLLAIGLALGGLIGVGLAYMLALRNRVYTGRSQPESLLGAPLLSDVPSFDLEGVGTPIPVSQAPRSAAAEAFRFAAASLDIRMRADSMKSFVVVSALNGTGKTTAVANLALAAAREGRRVLVLDTDFGNQELSRLLSKGEFALGPGLTDAVIGTVPADECIKTIHLGDGAEMSVLGRGLQPVSAVDFLRSQPAQQFLESIKAKYDLVLIDSPPLMQIAYSNTVVGFGDAAIVVVNHGSRVSHLEELAGRLNFMKTPVVGYIYNRAPLRREMTVTEGSMKDVIGDMGFAVAPKKRAGR